MRETELKMGKGVCQAVIFGESPGTIGGKVQCKKYVGKFTVNSLQDKADTNEYHTVCIGNPFAERGWGHTPQYAIRDAINRSKERIQKLQQGIDALEAALSEAESKS